MACSLKARTFRRSIDWQRVGRNCGREKEDSRTNPRFLFSCQHAAPSKGAITILSGLICEHFTRTLLLDGGLPANWCTYHQPRRSFEGILARYQVPPMRISFILMHTCAFNYTSRYLQYSRKYLYITLKLVLFSFLFSLEIPIGCVPINTNRLNYYCCFLVNYVTRRIVAP